MDRETFIALVGIRWIGRYIWAQNAYLFFEIRTKTAIPSTRGLSTCSTPKRGFKPHEDCPRFPPQKKKKKKVCSTIVDPSILDLISKMFKPSWIRAPIVRDWIHPIIRLVSKKKEYVQTIVDLISKISTKIAPFFQRFENTTRPSSSPIISSVFWWTTLLSCLQFQPFVEWFRFMQFEFFTKFFFTFSLSLSSILTNLKHVDLDPVLQYFTKDKHKYLRSMLRGDSKGTTYLQSFSSAKLESISETVQILHSGSNYLFTNNQSFSQSVLYFRSFYDSLLKKVRDTKRVVLIGNLGIGKSVSLVVFFRFWYLLGFSKLLLCETPQTWSVQKSTW